MPLLLKDAWIKLLFDFQMYFSERKKHQSQWHQPIYESEFKAPRTTKLKLHYSYLISDEASSPVL